MPATHGMASAEMPPVVPPPSIAASPSSNPGADSMAAAATTMYSTSKKQDHLQAGRRKLQEYRKKKAEEKKLAERNRPAEFVSQRPLPNTPPEEAPKKRRESSLNSFSEDVSDNGSSVVPEAGAKVHFHVGTLDGPNTRDRENLGDEPWKVDNIGESSRGLEESLDWQIEKACRTLEDDSHLSRKSESCHLPDVSGDASGSISSSLVKTIGAKVLQKDSGSSLSNAGESASDRIAGFYDTKVHVINKETAGSAPKTDVLGGDYMSFHSRGQPVKGDSFFSKKDPIGVGSDGPLSNGEGDHEVKRTVDASHSSCSMASSYNSLTASAIPKQQGNVTLVLQKEKIEQEQSDGRFASIAGVSDVKLGGTWVPKEREFLFGPSKQPSPFHKQETKPVFSSWPSDSFSHKPASASALSISSRVSHASFASASGKTLTMPTSTSEQDISSTEMLHEFSTSRLGIGSQNQFEEVQQNSERDDFAALEQHISDLTQEKFSLQRALDAARSLTESLAQENTALTEDFNSQGALINQLQGDIERQMDEIKAQSLVLNGIMVEREKAQQESNSAVERSQILAVEVIALEEKVLKLRSNELKLERDLEISKSECDTCRRQLLTLEKDRKNLQSMVEALQEDKKLLQGQLGKKIETSISETSSAKREVAKELRDASTSTEDFDNLQATTSSKQQEQDSVKEMKGSYQLSERIENRFEVGLSTSLGLDQVSSNKSPAITAPPVDHIQMINNIDILIMELETEKGSLIESLQKESQKASKLEALNAELSRKLEMQTQRLELAFAQNLAHERPAMLTGSSYDHQDNEFVDEGDEIVERVLGWIARLFPSGSSKRRTSKLL